MEERLAKIISYIFHPIFLPLYSLILLFDLKSCFSFELIFKARLMLMAFVAITTIVFPLSIILLMKHQGFILGYARLKLNSHKPLEIYAGFLAGAFVMLCVFYFI